MTTNPPEAPPAAPPGGPHDDGHDDGPRVTRDEIRDLARLRRSRGDRKIAGVAGGLARHLDIDPIIPRVLLVVLVFFGGAGILLYAAIWLVVPAEGSDEATVRLDDRSRTVALVIVGALSALALLGDSLGGWGFPWPVVLAGLVVLVVLMVRGREPRLHPLLRDSAPGVPHAGTVPVPVGPIGPVGPVGPVRPSRRRGPVLFWYALAVIALGAGVLGIVDSAGADVPGSAFPAVALGTSAVLLLVGAFWGRAGGLILLGLVSAVATAGATVADEVDAGHIESRPTTAASVQDRYDLTFGEIDLDLTRVTDLDALDGRTVEVEVEVAGRILVTVPDDLDVVVLSSLDEGQVQVFGDELGDGDQRTTLDGGDDAPELTLDVTTVFGEIEINREGGNR
ncbi:PspC domain-containing protein [Nocardioides sp.]|uniref:PspC domain-containing protein n=1 Tax=Nocardioides sp. TaxID=35761 RepID=UPI0027196D52|nr:PspC domain-containing protein [Nocardioides sp.]MDO9456286.1 PspC domain-containing protein [Nocardioides sp.]